MNPLRQAGAFHDVMVRLGLAYAPDGTPRTAGRRPSRYGRFVSHRVDEDVDALRRRVEELEARIAALARD